MPKRRPFTSKEIALLKALKRRKVRFLIVGLSAASLQGAPVVTQDIDLWVEDLSDPNFREALRSVGGFYVPSFGLNPPLIGGPGLELLDLVTHMHGLKGFDDEFKRAREVRVGTLSVKVLPIERILKSKSALGRAKDKAVLPVLRDALRTLQAVAVKRKGR